MPSRNDCCDSVLSTQPDHTDPSNDRIQICRITAILSACLAPIWSAPYSVDLSGIERSIAAEVMLGRNWMVGCVMSLDANRTNKRAGFGYVLPEWE